MRLSVRHTLFIAIGGIFVALLLFSAWWDRHMLPPPFQLLGIDIQYFFAKTLFYVGGKPVRVWFLIKSTLYLIFLWLLSRLANYLIRQITSRHSPFGDHRHYILSRLVSLFIFVIGILIWFQVENIQPGTLVVIGGALGVGIGFGLQSHVGNFIAGLILFFEQPIRIGDLIEFGDKKGHIVRIGTRCSWIRTGDNALIMIPNSELTTKDILNWTLSDPKLRIVVPVSVAHDSDIPKVMDVLLRLAEDHEDVLTEPAPEVILTELGEHTISLALRVWTIKGANDFARLSSDLYFEIIRSFRENGIVLPFPQFDIHLRREFEFHQESLANYHTGINGNAD